MIAYRHNDPIIGCPVVRYYQCCRRCQCALLPSAFKRNAVLCGDCRFFLMDDEDLGDLYRKWLMRDKHEDPRHKAGRRKTDS